MAERVTPFHSGLRLTPPGLRAVLGLSSRRIALRLRARLAARRRGGGGRGRSRGGLDPPWRGGHGLRPAFGWSLRLRARPLGSDHRWRLSPNAVRTEHIRPHVLDRSIGALAPLGRSGIARGVQPTRMIGPVRVLRVLRMLGPAAPDAVVVVVWRLAGDRALAGALDDGGAATGDRTLPRLNVRRGDAAAAQVTSTHPHVAPAVVGHRALWDARHEEAGTLPVLEDEARRRPQWPRKDHARAAVVPVGVVVRIVEQHDPETDAGVVVRAPVWIAHVAVAIVAEEARVIVVLLHVVRRDVVVPVGVAVRDDALGEVGEGDIRVAADAAIRNNAIIPMIFALDGIVDEGIGRRDGEDVPNAGVVVDVERIARGALLDFVVTASARETVVPRLSRIQDAHPAIGVDAEDGDVSVLFGAEGDPRRLPAGIRIVPAVGPDRDAGSVRKGSRLGGGRPAGERAH